LLSSGRGAALWLPPGQHPDDEALTDLIKRSVPAEAQEQVLRVVEQMAQHHPDGPHWHLALIGVEPAEHRRGHGSALLRYALDAVDANRLPAYLESSNPENIPLYQRHGFEVLGTVQAGSSPPITPMLRPSRE
jgi:ribosomal protein S18 acetylase RimI-like enzyme